MATLLILLSMATAEPVQKPFPKIHRPIQVVAPFVSIEIPPHLQG